MEEPKDILYRNWIKAGLGLLYVKEGIQDFIIDEINNFHKEKLSGAGSCTKHTIQNMLKCPTPGICGRPCRFHDNTDPGKPYTSCHMCKAIRTEIENAHRYGQPSYKNLKKSSKPWCTANWELAKCFMPAQGYADKNTADNTDLSGLISVILNHKEFQKQITENLGQHGNKFEKVRNARNDIMHNAKMETPTTDLNSYFNILNDVLNDSTHLQGLTKVKDAKDKLHQLQCNMITITTDDERRVRESLEALERKTVECIYEIDKVTEARIKKIGQRKEESMLVLEEKTQAGVCKIKEAVIRQQEEMDHMHKPADKEYKQKTDELKEEIVDHYMSNGYCVSSISVLAGDKVHVDGFFVMPEMQLVKPATNKSNVNSTSSDSITSICGLFHKNKQRIRRKVCIVGEAGRGKTTLCQKIISSWCTIHTNKEIATYSEPANTSFDNDDQDFLKLFKFLFYIPLRNHKTSNVVEMIKIDLVREGLHDLLNEVLVKESESCLVILDGLDEWVPEQSCTETLPFLDPREKFSVLITTRPWKLEVLRPEEHHIGQEIKLNGISRMDLFVKNVLEVLDKKIHNENKTVDSCLEYIRLPMIKNLKGVPLLLTQIICMWYDDIECGYTQTEIYCEMIEYLFQVTDRRQQTPNKTDIPDSKVSIIKHGLVHSLHIHKYGQILVNLSELAYCTLFNEGRENALVFQDSLSEIRNLTKDDVQFCLKVGLLSQEIFCSKVTSSSKKLSFLHKTFQEYFAAMYIANVDDDSRLTSMLHTFKCLNDVHEMAQVLIFLSGMRPDFVGALSRRIAELADKDEIVLKGRQSLCRFDIVRYSTNEFVLFDCITEGGYRDGSFPDGLVIHDIDFTHFGRFFKNGKSLLKCINTKKIKSLCVHSDMLKDFHQQNIVKLHATNASSQRHVNDIASVITGCLPSLACLHVGGCSNGFPYVNIGDLIPTLNHITCIGLEQIVLSHSGIEDLAKYLSGGTQLKEIKLSDIRCISCKQIQCVYKIDLLCHKTLNYLSLDDLKGHVELGQGIHLTTCTLARANIGSSFVECLKSSPSLEILILIALESSLTSIQSVYQMLLSVVLPTLKNLSVLRLEYFDCGQELLNISQMTSLKSMMLLKVTMTFKCVQCLVDSLSQNNNKIYVNMDSVTVNPKQDMSAVREYISDKDFIYFKQEDGDTGTFSLKQKWFI